MCSVTYPEIFLGDRFQQGAVMPRMVPGQSAGGDQAAKLPEAPKIVL